jgi:hypothetical protein
MRYKASLSKLVGARRTENAKKSRARHLRWREANPDKWRRMRQEQNKRYYAATRRNNRRHRKPWTAEEDREITNKRRPTDRELSRALGRSMQAVYRRRTQLRKASSGTCSRASDPTTANIRLVVGSSARLLKGESTGFAGTHGLRRLRQNSIR